MTDLAAPRDVTPRPPETAARITFRQPLSTAGYIDAAWWPRTRNLTAELPALMDVFWTACRDINRITFNLANWDPAPRQMQIEGRTVRLGGFVTSDPITVRLSDAWGKERIDILVIAPDTDPRIVDQAFVLAGETDNPLRADQILAYAELDVRA